MPQTPAPSDDDRDEHDPYIAFRYHNYRLFIFGWFISLLGTRVQSIAIGWEMYQRTGEALALGLVGLAQALPLMAFALPAGYLADAFPRRQVVMWSLSGMTFTSLGLAYLSFTEGPLTWMYILLALDTTAVILGRPARTAVVPHLVPTKVFPNAVTWNMSLSHIASVLGPAVGGVVVVLGVPFAYVIAAFSSLIFIGLLTQITLTSTTATPRGTPLQRVLAGLQFVRKTRLLLALILLDFFAILFGGATYLLPIYAEDILQVGATGFGWLEAAPAAGAFCMALALAYLPSIRHAGRALLIAVAGFGLATVIFGLSTLFWLSLVMLFFTGILDNISMVVRHTLTQLLTPDHMRGRVSAVSSLFTGASNQLGGFEAGLAAHWFGPVISVVSGGIGTIIVVGLTALTIPQILAVGRMEDTRPADEN